MSKLSSILPSLRQRLKAFWTERWTGFLGWSKVVVGAAGAGLGTMGQFINNSDVKSAIDMMHLDPKIMLGLAMLGVLTLMSMEHK